MAEHLGFEPNTRWGALGLANQDSDLAACVLQVAEGWSVDHHARRHALASNEAREPSRLTFLSGGERVRTMPTPYGAFRFQTGAGALTGSLSVVAEPNRIERLTSRSPRLSKTFEEPTSVSSLNGTRCQTRTGPD